MKNIFTLFALVVLTASCSHHACKGDKPAVAAAEGDLSNYVEVTREPSAECPSSKYVLCKQARKNDVADMYLLTANGDLFRTVNGNLCQVTNGVTDYKVSQHPNDAAVMYYTRNGGLWILNNENRGGGQCPGTIKKELLPNVDKDNYKVVSNTHTTIVNAALDNGGRFVAWDNVRPVYQDGGVAEFQMNPCYGQQGKSFSTVVLFTRDQGGAVTKVRVEGGAYLRNNSNETTRRYQSISDFKKAEGVCK